MRMNIKHLNDIFALTEWDFYSTELLLKGEAIKTVFKNRTDVPQPAEEKEYAHFNDTAIFATQLNLILEKLKNPKFTPEAHEEAPAVKNLLQNLPNLITHVLKQYDVIFSHQQTSVQVELLRKMLLITEKIEQDQEFAQCATQVIKTSYKKICQQLPSSPINLSNCQSHPALLRLEINIENHQEFITASKRAYATAKNYAERLMLLIHSIYPSWEILKDQLNLNDLEWLEEQVNNLAPEYANLPSRFSKMMGRHAPLASELVRYAKKPLYFLTLGSSGFFAHQLYETIQQCKASADLKLGNEAMLANSRAMIEGMHSTLKESHIMTILAGPQLSDVTRQQLSDHTTKIINFMQTLQSAKQAQQDSLVATERNLITCNYNQYYPLLGMLACGLISTGVLTYGAYRYFKAPVEHKAPQPPAWLQPLKEKLEAEQAPSALNTRRDRR